MRCELFWERFDRLDAREEPGSAMKRHLAACDSCRDRYALVERAIQLFSEEGATESAAEAAIEERVMAAVRLSPRPRREFFTPRDWILVGLVIFLSVILMPFGHDAERLIGIFGLSFAIPLALVSGLVVSVYGVLFIGTHMDEVHDFVQRKITHEN